MAGASDIRAGGAFVELSAKDAKLGEGLIRAQAKLRAFGAVTQATVGKVEKSLRSASASIVGFADKMMKAATLAATPFVAGVAAFSQVETKLASLHAAAGLTDDQLKKVKESVNQIS